MKWLQFIISHSIFISICAVALCCQTFLLLHLPINYYLLGFLFSATLFSYNCYWLISKFFFLRNKPRLSFFVQNKSYLFLLFLAAIPLTYFLYKIPGLIQQMIIPVILTILYSMPLWPLKKSIVIGKAGFIKTVLLAFTWTYVTVILPGGGHLYSLPFPEVLLFIARFLFMLLLCSIFDARDVAIDKIHGLQSLATDVTTATFHNIMAAVFSGYIIIGIMIRYYLNNVGQMLAFLLTGLIVYVVYRQSLKKQGYYFYYFIVDGLMLISALATYVASI